MLLHKWLDDGEHKQDRKSESCRQFSKIDGKILTNNPVLNKVAMADGTIDESSAGTHQRRVAFVVPAGRKERILRRRAWGFCFMRLLSTERPMLRFMFCSWWSGRISGPFLDHANINSFAVDCPSLPNLAISVTAKGKCPNIPSNLPTSGSFFEFG